MANFEHLPGEPVYNTRAAQQRTGVPADTFRAWERRYSLPHPSRTSGNQRLYSERDVATISWLRDRTRDGLTISQAVALFSAQARSPTMPAIVRPEDGLAAGRWDRLQAEVIAALADFDAARADRVVEEAIALGSVEDVCLQILQPTLAACGDRWERGEIGVDGEHFASAFVQRKIGALFNLSRPDTGRGPLLAACPEGELHELGLLITSLFVSRRGFRVIYLGPNLPLANLLAAIARLRPPVVLLSAATEAGAERLIEAAGTIAGAAPAVTARPSSAPTLVGYGGHAFIAQPGLRTRVDGRYLGPDADAAVAAINRLLGTA